MVAYSCTGKYLVTGSLNGEIFVWNNATQTIVEKYSKIFSLLIYPFISLQELENSMEIGSSTEVAMKQKQLDFPSMTSTSKQAEKYQVPFRNLCHISLLPVAYSQILQILHNLYSRN